jgi:hypothetical protein
MINIFKHYLKRTAVWETFMTKKEIKTAQSVMRKRIANTYYELGYHGQAFSQYCRLMIQQPGAFRDRFVAKQFFASIFPAPMKRIYKNRRRGAAPSPLPSNNMGTIKSAKSI